MTGDDAHETVIRTLLEALAGAKAERDAYRSIACQAVWLASTLHRELEMVDAKCATYRRHVQQEAA